jgi:hypothetical protein
MKSIEHFATMVVPMVRDILGEAVGSPTQLRA